MDLQAKRAPFALARGRLGVEQSKIRIYQLFVGSSAIRMKPANKKPNGCRSR